jgi:hypothetical protein
MKGYRVTLFRGVGMNSDAVYNCRSIGEVTVLLSALVLLVGDRITIEVVSC